MNRPIARLHRRIVSNEFVGRLHQPEYTGENRCVPCTVVNLGIAVVVSIALAYWALITVGPAPAAALGGLAFTGSAGLIYLRGYLVPYTPTLTKRYFPDRVLRWFDKQPTAEQPVEEFEPIDVEETLLEMNALTPCEDRADLCLEDSFQRAWRETVEGLDDTAARQQEIVELLDVEDVRNVDIREYGTATVVSVNGQHVGQWESDAAFVADIAADKTLRGWDEKWNDIDVVNRSRVLSSLRMFLERCPSCGSPVTMGQETVESCCRTMDVVAVSCEGCGSRLFEIELTEELQQQL